MNDNNFTSLPETLGELSELLVLNISDNELSAFPNSVTNLRKLRELYANRNVITVLPNDMNRLADLTILELNTNKLSDLPIGIQELRNLVIFRVAVNNLEFNHLLSYANRELSNFNYSPQAFINEEQNILASVNQAITLSVETEGNGNIYQWKRDEQEVSTLQRITMSSVKITDAGTYTAFVTNPALPNLRLQRRQIRLDVGCVEGSSFEIKQPQQTVFCDAQPFGLLLEIKAEFAGNPTINWRKDGAILAFANEKTYTVTEAGKYTAEVKTAAGCISISNEIEITTLPQPKLSIELINNTTFVSSVTTDQSITYQWLKDGEIIRDATEDTYIPTEDGEYSLLILSEAGCSTVSQSIIFNKPITTGIEAPIELRSLTLFPNPNNGIFFLDFGMDYPNGTPKFTVIDGIGRKINLKTERISSTRYKVYADKLTGGMYQILIETVDGAALKKFIISE